MAWVASMCLVKRLVLWLMLSVTLRVRLLAQLVPLPLSAWLMRLPVKPPALPRLLVLLAQQARWQARLRMLRRMPYLLRRLSSRISRCPTGLQGLSRRRRSRLRMQRPCSVPAMPMLLTRLSVRAVPTSRRQTTLLLPRWSSVFSRCATISWRFAHLVSTATLACQLPHVSLLTRC